MNIPYSNKKHFDTYHNPQQQQLQDESILGVGYSTRSAVPHPMNFNNSHKQQQQQQLKFEQQQQYGTPVSDSGSNFASSYSSSASSYSSASSLALSNLGSSFSSALSTSTMGSPPNFYYGSSPNPPQQTLITQNPSHHHHSKANSFTPTNNSSFAKHESNANNTYGTPKSGASQIRPIVHPRPMSWDDVGEYARQSYSTSSSSNSGLFMNELSSSMDDLTIASSPGIFGSSQYGSSLSTSYANSFNESKMDNSSVASSTPIDNIFVRSVVDKVLSDMDESNDEESETTFKPRPPSQFHQRGISMDRHKFYPQGLPQAQQFKNSVVNRRTLSQSCPTGMAQMNGAGYQLFQQQQQQTNTPNNNGLQEDSAQHGRFYYSSDGRTYNDNRTFTQPPTNNSHVMVQQHAQSMMSHDQTPQYQSDTLAVVNYNNNISHSPPQTTTIGVSPMVGGDLYPFPQSTNNTVSNTPNNNSNQQAQQVCQFFKKGECKFGDKCRNVHLKNKSKIDEQSRKKLKSIRCRFGVNCPFGHECYYYHTEADFDDTHSNNGSNEENNL